jgi:1-acyl-sn-glycerol-3-phosphate acyltransferase
LIVSEWLARGSIWAAARLAYRLRISGRENVPASGPALLVCNHVSFLDWLLIQASVGRPVRFVMDHAFFRGRLLTSALLHLRVIPIATPREDRSKLSVAYDRIHEELARGEIVCIFPEGMITRDGSLGTFKPGVTKVLRQSPVPVVPMGIRGMWGSLASFEGGPAFGKPPRRFRARVEVRIGKAVPPEQVTLAGLRERVAGLIE